MFAVIKVAGHQHTVEKDQVFLSELTGNDENSEFECQDVLMVGEGSDVKVGKPTVDGAVVKLKVLKNLRGQKIRGFTYQRRKGKQRHWGHRQELQRLQVVEIKG